MLSKESLLLALNFGCLNSHAYVDQLSQHKCMDHHRTNTCSIGRMTAFFIVMSDLVEVIFVELANETSKIAVFEVLWEDGFGETLVLCAVRSNVGSTKQASRVPRAQRNFLDHRSIERLGSTRGPPTFFDCRH